MQARVVLQHILFPTPYKYNVIHYRCNRKH